MASIDLPSPAAAGKVALIAGPTASGKSALAMALARSLRDAGRDALIVNADASGVYCDIPILSAQPSAADRAEVPHALVGHIDAAENCNAARWMAEARAVIDEGHASGTIPIVVGGTGLYIQALLRGIAPIPTIDPGIRTEVRALSAAAAHDRLQRLDAASAARLRATDTTRVQRALEVVLSTGRSLGGWQERREGGLGAGVEIVPCILQPPRDWLRARCASRFDGMITAGAVAEVAALIERGLDPALPAMRAIGVAELQAYRAGGWTIAEAGERAVTATRQLAKRQYTFFRGQFPSGWQQELETDRALPDGCIVTKLRDQLLTH